MRGFRPWFGVRVVVIGLAGAAALGWVVMSLWNWLLPGITGWQVIGFWQALGLLLLSRILFGGFRGRFGGGMHWRRRFVARWEAMTPEERDRFRAGMESRCGGPRRFTSAPGTPA